MALAFWVSQWGPQECNPVIKIPIHNGTPPPPPRMYSSVHHVTYLAIRTRIYYEINQCKENLWMLLVYIIPRHFTQELYFICVVLVKHKVDDILHQSMYSNNLSMHHVTPKLLSTMCIKTMPFVVVTRALSFI